MKRQIILVVLALLLVFGYCFWGLAPTKPSAVPTGASENLPSRTGRLDRDVPPTIATTKTPTVALDKPQRPLTDERQRILDSTDVLSTIKDIRLNGSQDKKDSAAFLLVSCSQVISTSRANNSSNAGIPHDDKGSHEERSALETQKIQALNSLLSRCKGIGELAREDRAALKQDLISGSASNKSELGRLHALVLRQDDRWNSEESKLVTTSLYSGDPIAERGAFFAIQGAIDKNAPSGADRSKAWENSFSPEFLGQPLSEFERLGACYMINRCAANSNEWMAQAPKSAEVDRLAEKYKAAINAHLDATVILSIR
jgi:hypothetical protein